MKTFRTKDEARAFAAKVETQKRENDYTDPDAGKATLGESFDSMMSTAILRETTRAKYATLGRLYIAGGSLAERPIRTITRKELREHLSGLTLVKASDGTATKEALARLLHRVFEGAVEDGLRVNPMHGLKVEAARRREPRFLNEAEVAELARAVDPRYRALVWTLAISRLRIGEASIRW